MIVNRRNVFCLFFWIFSTASIIYYLSVFPLPAGISPAPRPILIYSIFDHFLVEVFVIFILGLILVDGGVVSRLVLYSFSCLFIVIYNLQFFSVYEGKEFLSRLAIDNWDHAYLFFTFEYLFFPASMVLLCTLLVFLLEKSPSNRLSRTRYCIALVLPLVFVIISLTSSSWLPGNVMQSRKQYFSHHGITHSSPIISLYSVLVRQDIKYGQALVHEPLKTYELEEINNFGFHYDPTQAFPVITSKIYETGPPFSRKKVKVNHPPNVIVLFSEGLSARAIGIYNSKYSDLTPHIDTFAESAMVVLNYYSHTAATYRALLGQLCSLFPAYGGLGGWQSNDSAITQTKYLSLADLFSHHGYETIFLDPHHRDHPSRIDIMLSRVGFDTVLTGDILAEQYLNGSAPLGQMVYSDHQYFRSVTRYLQEAGSVGNTERPFFIALYNFGTHPFLKNSKDGLRYGSGNNSILNNFHNFDHAFGEFWRYFRSSPYLHNTIIVFTADHSHYHEKAYVEAFEGDNYQKLIVDRIPLIIYDPTRNLPKSYDAEYAGSLDFAPTIAHYLGLENIRNHFLGTSIFERNLTVREAMSIASVGQGETFLIDKSGIYRLGDSHRHQGRLLVLNKFIEITRNLEKKDRLWDGNATP